jgi:hypothetical protein
MLLCHGLLACGVRAAVDEATIADLARNVRRADTADALAAEREATQAALADDERYTRRQSPYAHAAPLAVAWGEEPPEESTRGWLT